MLIFTNYHLNLILIRLGLNINIALSLIIRKRCKMLLVNRRKMLMLLIAVVALALIAIIYLNFFYVKECKNYECWQEQMKKCSKAKFVNEVTEASWGYEIKGTEERECSIDVTLLIAKEGELGINKLLGHKMTCSYPKGIAAYPEQDLSKCHGILKEELLTIKLNKYHAYLLENLGKVAEGLEKVI